MHKALKYLVAGGLGLLGLLLMWGLIEPYVIAVEHEVAPIGGLPAAWDGQRIGVLADFQVGMWLDNVGTVRRSVERLVAERPAAVLIAGDFVYGPSDDISDDAIEAVGLGRVRKLEPQQNRGNRQHGLVVSRPLFVAGCNAAKLLEPIDQAFNAVACAV